MIVRENVYKRSDNLKSRRWTKEEDDILKLYYSSIPSEDIVQYLPHRSLNAIKIRGNNLGLHRYSESKFHNQWRDSELLFLKEHWRVMSDYLMSNYLDRTPRAIKAKRGELKLFRQDKNRSLTYEDLSKFLRGNTYEWKQKSIEHCNGRCVLSGSSDYAIHHIHNFKDILEQYIEKYDIEILDNVNNYSEIELEYIVRTFNEFHDQFPLGVCVDKQLHKLFHHLYGKKFNTIDQWNEFAENYRKGKYNH